MTANVSLSNLRGITYPRVRQRLRSVTKSMYHRLPARSSVQRIVFIVGCQRSGTTLLNSIFDRDWRTGVYKEQSRLSSRDSDKGLRLNPLDEVAAAIAANPAPIVVLKPLVESQNLPELLDYFQGSKAVWLYRRHTDVAASYVRRWNDRSISDLRSIVYDRNDWRNERVSPEVREIVRAHFSEGMAPHDASALYWFSRNRHFIDRGLDSDPRVTLCCYEMLVEHPRDEVARLYDFIDARLSTTSLTDHVHARSVQRGSSVTLSESVDALCTALLNRLDDIRASQSRN
jgi:hypothetical protein